MSAFERRQDAFILATLAHCRECLVICSLFVADASSRAKQCMLRADTGVVETRGD
jgi:hypothetical protein